MERLCAYDWPGNVRELENLIERLTILRGEGEIEATTCPASAQMTCAPSAPGAPDSRRAASPSERGRGSLRSDLILQALEQTHWNKNQAAQLLGLNRTTLIEKIKKKGLADRTSRRAQARPSADKSSSRSRGHVGSRAVAPDGDRVTSAAAAAAPLRQAPAARSLPCSQPRSGRRRMCKSLRTAAAGGDR